MLRQIFWRWPLLFLVLPLLADAQGLSVAKKEAEALLDAALPFAENMLQQHREFFPYGYAMDKNGKTVAVSGYDSRERPPSSDLIRQLKKVFVSGAKSGEYKATALVYDVRINLPGTGAKSDAIAVSLNHRDNYSVVVFFPYKFESAKLVVGDPIANQGEADIFRR